MSTSKTTRLQAINAILSAAGEAPVANLADSGGVDSEMAEAILDETIRAVLGIGWNFNTRCITIVPDVNGELLLPESVLRIDANDLRMTNLTIRDNKVFDMETGTTNQHTQSLEIEVVELLDWQDIPQNARQYILKKSARLYVDRTVGDGTLSRAARADEAEAHAELKRHELTAGNYRVFDQRHRTITDRPSPNDWIY